MAIKLNFLPEQVTKAEFKARRVLCARPDYFDVVEGDNAHQREGYAKFQADPEGNRARLLASWQKVANELTRLGHELLIPDLVPQAPDQVFAADVAIHFVNKEGECCVLLSHMNSPERQLEVVAAEELFRTLGYKVYHANENYKHEGTGDGLYAEDLSAIIHGYGPRSNLEACQHVADTTGKVVIALPLTTDLIDDNYQGDAGGLRSKDIKGFHLDVLAQPLPTGHVICYWKGLPSFTQKFFDLFYDGFFDEDKRTFSSKLIKISKKDYEKFATNCLAVPDKTAPNGYTLFIPEDISRNLKNKLSKLGYCLFEVDIEVARWTGGGLHCMFNVEHDFSLAPSRELNYVQRFIIDKWTNPNSSGWDHERRRAVPGLRMFRPRKSSTGEAPAARPS